MEYEDLSENKQDYTHKVCEPRDEMLVNENSNRDMSNGIDNECVASNVVGRTNEKLKIKNNMKPNIVQDNTNEVENMENDVRLPESKLIRESKNIIKLCNNTASHEDNKNVTSTTDNESTKIDKNVSKRTVNGSTKSNKNIAKRTINGKSKSAKNLVNRTDNVNSESNTTNKTSDTKVNVKEHNGKRQVLSQSSVPAKISKINNERKITKNEGIKHNTDNMPVHKEKEISSMSDDVAHSKEKDPKSTSKRKKITLQEYKLKKCNKTLSVTSKNSKSAELSAVKQQDSGKLQKKSLTANSKSIDFHNFKQNVSCICISSQIISFSKKTTTCISVSFNSKGIHLELPKYKVSSKTVPVSLSESNVEHALVYCDKYSYAFISIITSSRLGETLKENLKTYKKQSPYFNPDAETLKQLKFSFLLKDVTDDIIAFLNNIYKEKLVKIDQESAITMLKASPSKNNSNSPPLSVSNIFVYPQVGGIQVKSNDIACLANGSLLNDTIIEFYLKFIYHEKIPSGIQARTHIFSSFFYQALECAFLNQFKNRQKQETDTEGIKNKWILNNTWTKNVDIFSKDFIFIPINRKRHWYLAVICYLPELFKTSEEIVLDCDSPEKKEASEIFKPSTDNETRKTRRQNEKSHCEKREPCICFFDSMDNRPRMNETKKEVAKTLKEFLEKLWKSRNPDSVCNWNKLLFLKACCPQQKNRYDCGIYLLQYVESFFEKPISYFQDPLPDLRDWFRHDNIKHKRTEIKNVISELKQKQSCTIVSPTTSCNSSLDIIDLS